MQVTKFNNVQALIDHVNHAIASGDRGITKKNVKQLIENNRGLFFENPDRTASCLRILAGQLICTTFNSGTKKYSEKLMKMADHIEQGQGCFTDVIQTWAAADKTDWHGLDGHPAKISLEKIEKLIDDRQLVWDSRNPCIGQSLKCLGERIEEEFPKDEKAQQLAKRLFEIAEQNVFPEEVIMEILHRVPLAKMGAITTVSQMFHSLAEQTRMDWINEHKLRICDLGFRSAEEAINYFVNSPWKREFKYFDFTGIPLQSNDQLEKLLTNCPNITALIIPESQISEDALEHLQHVPCLTTLNLDHCWNLNRDALKCLKYTPELLSLNISWCKYESDGLKYLQHVPKLLTLDMSSSLGIQSDVLKYLQHTPKLRDLNISSCNQLERDALKHLEHVHELTALVISFCDQLEPDALKHLEHVHELTTLDIHHCISLEPDALKHLEHVHELTTLRISGCDQLEPDGLKHLQKSPKLRELDISYCSEFEADALKHLEQVHELTKLDAIGCTQLDWDVLIQLKKVPQSIRRTF